MRQVAKKKTSVERFSKFYDAKGEQGAALVKAYGVSRMAGDPGVILAWSLKTACVFRNFTDELRTAPLPKSLREPQLHDAYCNALQSQSAAPEKMAKQAIEYCLDGPCAPPDSSIPAFSHFISPEPPWTTPRCGPVILGRRSQRCPCSTATRSP